MKGAAVLAFQRKLIKLGYIPANGATGTYDAVTKAAVSRLQKAYKFAATGIATPATQSTVDWLYQRALDKEPPGTLKPGWRGAAVVSLQKKLFRAGYLRTIPNGIYDTPTKDAVARIQQAYKLKYVTGWATPETIATIDRIVAQVNARKLAAGTQAPGMYGVRTLNVQKALITLGFLPSSYNNGWYDAKTKAAVASYQKTVGLSATGTADPRTLNALNASVARAQAEARNRKLDPRCMTGRAICVNKAARKVYWIVNGKVLKTLDARFAKPGYTTPTGAYTVQRKILMDRSRRYENAKMPFSIYYSGGRAVHYSYGFAAQGWNGGSHGCVNLRDWAGAQWLYNQSRVGDKVIIYSR